MQHRHRQFAAVAGGRLQSIGFSRSRRQILRPFVRQQERGVRLVYWMRRVFQLVRIPQSRPRRIAGRTKSTIVRLGVEREGRQIGFMEILAAESPGVQLAGLRPVRLTEQLRQRGKREDEFGHWKQAFPCFGIRNRRSRAARRRSNATAARRVSTTSSSWRRVHRRVGTVLVSQLQASDRKEHGTLFQRTRK